MQGRPVLRGLSLPALALLVPPLTPFRFCSPLLLRFVPFLAYPVGNLPEERDDGLLKILSPLEN
jgi:hypothetical protein